MELLKGIAVVIDNEIGIEESVGQIIEKIKANNIPLLSFDSLDEVEKYLPNLTMVNFFILDWKMFDLPDDDLIGVRMGSTAVADSQRRVLDLIKKIKDVCFAPIFIFTTESEDDIRDQIIPALKENNLHFDEEERNFVFVKNKTEVLKYNRFFKVINDWINNAPSIYLLKIWDNELLKAKNQVFWDLYNASKGGWPKVLWQHYEKENESPYACLNETIFQLIMSDVSLNKLDSKKIIKKKPEASIDEIKHIFKRTMFKEKDLFGIKPGDIFKYRRKYYLNIRPECDTINGRNQFEDEIYVIEGNKLSSGQVAQVKKEQYSKTGFIEKISEAFVFLLDGKDIIKFSFSKIRVKKFSELQDKRICRLLPPFITNIQQRFNSYLGRFGIPRLPHDLEKELLKPQNSVQANG